MGLLRAARRELDGRRPWMSSGEVGEDQQSHANQASPLGVFKDQPTSYWNLTHRMIRSIGSSDNASAFAYGVRLARSGPLPGALGRQLSALERRRRLRVQQLDLQAGGSDRGVIPPYPNRPRPPS